VCATWFCKHVRGATGQRFWRSLEQLLSIAERELSRYCLLQIGVEAEMLARLLPHGSDRGAVTSNLDAAASTARPTTRPIGPCGHVAGRERELFRRAAAVVNDLRWATCSESAAPASRLSRASRRTRITATETKDFRRGSWSARSSRSPPATRASGRDLQPFDPLELPRLLVDVLPTSTAPDAEALAGSRRNEDQRAAGPRPSAGGLGLLVEPSIP